MILATFASVATTIGYVLIALLCFMVMIVIHEFGHFLAGRLLGFKVEEFAIGFGPAIFKRTLKSGMVFSLRPFPLGGFCQFEGEDEDGNESPTAFNKQAPWKRLIVLFSGAFFNFASAIIIITILFSTYGQVLPNISKVYDTAPQQTVQNVEAGDVIIRVNGRQVNILLGDELSTMLAKQEGDVQFTVLRDGEVVEYTLTRGTYNYQDADGNNFENYGFGIQTSIGAVRLNFFRALGRSFGFCFFVVYQILATLGKLLTFQIGMQSVGGPVTTIKTVATATSYGLSSLVYAVSIISANLAVMNLLPLPALDGSRMVFVLIEWIVGKPVPRKVEAVIHAVGLILLFAFAIFADVFQFLVA